MWAFHLDSSFFLQLREVLKSLRKVPTVASFVDLTYSEGVDADSALSKIRLERFECEPMRKDLWSVDGGTRWLKGPAPVAVVGVTISKGLRGALAYPSLGFGEPMSLEGPFVLAPSDKEVRGKVSTVPLIDVEPIVGKKLTYASYNAKTMLDENRIYLETLALQDALERSSGTVLIDGPLLPTPTIFSRLANASMFGKLRRKFVEAYVLSYVYNIYKRMKVVDGKEERVVGFVKRLNRSHKILMNSEGPSDEEVLLYLSERLPVGTYYFIDKDFINIKSIREYFNEKYGIKMFSSRSREGEPTWGEIFSYLMNKSQKGNIVKNVMYVVVKEKAWSVTFRLEALREETLKEALRTIIAWASNKNSYPLPLLAADELAKKLGKVIASMVRAEAQKLRVFLEEVEDSDI